MHHERETEANGGRAFFGFEPNRRQRPKSDFVLSNKVRLEPKWLRIECCVFVFVVFDFSFTYMGSLPIHSLPIAGKPSQIWEAFP